MRDPDAESAQGTARSIADQCHRNIMAYREPRPATAEEAAWEPLFFAQELAAYPNRPREKPEYALPLPVERVAECFETRLRNNMARKVQDRTAAAEVLGAGEHTRDGFWSNA